VSQAKLDRNRGVVMGRVADPVAASSAMDAEEAAQALFSLKASPIVTAQRPSENGMSLSFARLPPGQLGPSALSGSPLFSSSRSIGNGNGNSPPRTLSFSVASPPGTRQQPPGNNGYSALGSGIGLRTLGPTSTANHLATLKTAASNSVITTTQAARSPRMMALRVAAGQNGVNGNGQNNSWSPRALVYAAERAQNEEFNRVRGEDDDNEDDDNDDDDDDEDMTLIDLGESADSAAGTLCSLMHVTSAARNNGTRETSGGSSTSNNSNGSSSNNGNNGKKHESNGKNKNGKSGRGTRSRKNSVSSASGKGKYPALVGGPRVVKGRPRAESTLSINIRMTNTTLGDDDYDAQSVSTEPAMSTSGEQQYQQQHQTGAYSPESRRRVINRFLEKRRNRIWKKRIKYGVRKHFADSRLRVKGRFVRKEDEEVLRDLLVMT
jgi:hypothetical protein